MKSVDFWKTKQCQNDTCTKKENRTDAEVCQRRIRTWGPRCILRVRISVRRTNGRTSKTRCKEHRKSALAEHRISAGNCIDFRGTSILNRTSGHLDRLVNEAHLNSNYVNRECGFILSQAWSPVFNVLMNVKSGPSTAGTWLHPQTLFALSSTLTSNYIMTRGDFGCGQFPDDEDRDDLEKSVCSPFNHLTPLLDWEYFIEWGFWHILRYLVWLDLTKCLLRATN